MPSPFTLDPFCCKLASCGKDILSAITADCNSNNDKRFKLMIKTKYSSETTSKEFKQTESITILCELY